MLVATDVASRGIDVPGITHIINYDLPDTIEIYVHRCGEFLTGISRQPEAVQDIFLLPCIQVALLG